MLGAPGPRTGHELTTVVTIMPQRESETVVLCEQPGAGRLATAIRERLPELDVGIVDPASASTADLRDVRILLTESPPSNLALLNGAPRWVHALTAGVDGYDLDALAERGVILTNASGVAAEPAAEQIPAYLLASSLSGVLAQRLLRRNCPDCRAPVDVGEGFRTKYNIPADVTFYEGQGCPTCDGTGTKGRIGAYELLVADRDIQEAIHDRDAEANLVDRARRGGMHLMFEDGLIKAMKGHVAPAEILRSLDLPSEVEIDGGRLLDSADATWEERRRGTYAGAPTESVGAEGPRQALVVSDESAQRAMTAHLLQEAGMVVTQAESGRTALDSVHHQRPGLVVADVASPDLDGVTLAESLRREPDLGRIPVVLIAEAYSARQEATALDAGADDYLVKPVDPERLLARIRRLFRIYGTWEEAPQEATGAAS